MSTPEPWPFEDAIAAKPAEKGHLSDAQWYVCCVAQSCLDHDGLNCGDFRFTMYPPNPEIKACFDARMDPVLAAVKLFSVRH